MFRKCLLTVLLLLAFAAGIRAGEAEQLFRMLDQIERDFWTAAAIPSTDPIHKEADQKLRKFHFRIGELQRKIHRQNLKYQPNLAAPCMVLIDVFNTTSANSLRNDTIRLSGTGMGDYQKEFTKLQRHKRTKGTQNLPKYPSLKTINRTAYSSWVQAVYRQNTQKIRNYAQSGKKKKNRIDNRLKNNFGRYAIAIAELRSGLVALAQDPTFQSQE